MSLLLDLAEAAGLLGFSYSTIRHWTYERNRTPPGWPAPVRIGRSVRYRRQDLERFIETLNIQGAGPVAPIPKSSQTPTAIPRGRATHVEKARATAAGMTVSEYRRAKAGL